MSIETTLLEQLLESLTSLEHSFLDTTDIARTFVQWVNTVYSTLETIGMKEELTAWDYGMAGMRFSEDETLTVSMKTAKTLLLSMLSKRQSQDSMQTVNIDLFGKQFPAGLPFGKIKPSVSITPNEGSQAICFEQALPDVFVIRKSVYPNLNYQTLKNMIAITPENLTRMNQTEWERMFFEVYSNKYNMYMQDVPLLLPQTWIQWHSKTKPDLRAQSSSYADDLYRVDFVVFWNHRRFAIMVSDFVDISLQT